MRTLATVVLLFFLLAAPSTAEIKTVKIRTDYPGSMFLDYFKFTETGHVTITVSSISVASMPVTSTLSRPDPSLFGFYLLSDETSDDFHESKISCDLQSEFISLLFTFKDLEFSFNKSYHVTYPKGYSLYFANCNQLSHVTMHVRTELYNIDDNGTTTTKDYLSAGIMKLPRLYFIFSVIYMCFLAIWMFVCFMNHTYCHKIHLLMGVLLVTKAINLFCAAEVQHSVKVTGTRSYKWDVLFYVFQFITPVLLYTVIAVIFNGWSFVKVNAKMSLIAVIPLQALATILFKVTGVNGIDCDVGLLEFCLLVVNTILIGTMIAPMIVSCCETYETDRKANVTLCSWLSTMVCVYLFTNFILGIVVNNLAYTYHWESNATEEIISLVFYIVMFLMFMPFEKHQYFVQLNEASAVRSEEV